MTDKELKKIADILDERKLQENEILFSQEDKADHLYLIKSGFVEVIIDSPTSSEKRSIRNLGLGQSVGEMSWIDRGVRSATVRAVTKNTTVVSVPIEALDRLCEKNPRIGYRIFRNMASDLSFRLRQDSEPF